MVEFNSNFGYNVKNFQKMQQMKFGSNIRAGINPQNNINSMNKSVFKPQLDFNAPNMFTNNNVNLSQKYSFNGVEYNNAYAMLNENGQQVQGNSNGSNGINKMLKTANKGLEVVAKDPDKISKTFKKVGEAFDKIGQAFGKIGKAIANTASKVANGVKSAFNKLFGKKDADKAGDAGKVLDDIKTAQDKETLTKALEGGKAEQKANLEQTKSAEKNQKAAQKGKASADKAAGEADKKLKGEESKLSQEESSLEKAKGDVATAKGVLEAATRGVSSAQQALEAAKAAATPENPNTVAISNAESQLKLAQEKEAHAKSDLAQKEQIQEQAQRAVDNQKQVVSTADAENKKSQEAVAEADQKVDSANSEIDTARTEGEQISQGVKDGEQKLDKMNSETPSEETTLEQDDSTLAQDPNAPTDPLLKNRYETNNQLIESSGFTAEQKETIYQARENIKNMKPGDTIRCGADEYAMDESGNVTINGQPFEAHGFEKPMEVLAETAVDSSMRKAKSDNRKSMEDKLIQQNKPKTSGNSGTNSKPEIDTTTPGAKWSKTTSVSGEGFSSKEKVVYQRNEDGTITETSVRGVRILDENGKIPIKETLNNGGVGQGRMEIDYKNGTRTTDVNSMKMSSSVGKHLVEDMGRGDRTINDADGNVFVSYKDGEYYNAKGKKISKEKAIDLINKNKAEGLKYVQNMKKKSV